MKRRSRYPFSSIVYRFMLLLYPRSFRARFSGDLTDDFHAMRAPRPGENGRRAAWRCWRRTLVDLARSVPAEHAAARRCRRGQRRPGSRRRSAADRSRGVSRALDSLRQDSRFALRALGRSSRGVTLIVVATLALGMGSATTVFTIVDGVLLKPLPFHGAERYAHLSAVVRSERFGEIRGMGVADASFLEYRERLSGFEALEGYSERDINVSGGDRPETLQGAAITAGLFPMLGVQPARGRVFREEENESGADRVVIIGYGVWMSRFGGNPDVLGRNLRLDGEEHLIVGIMPRGFSFPGETRVWIPKLYAPTWAAPRFGGVTAVGRLRAGVTMELAGREAATLAHRLAVEHPESNTGFSVQLAGYHDVLVGDSRETLLLLLGAVAVVLLIACTNVANLLITRASERGHEMAVRASLGASRGRILLQLTTESVILSLAACTAGVILARWGLASALALVPASLPRAAEIALDARALAFAVALSLMTGVLFGVLPTLQGSRSDLNAILKGGRTPGAGRRQNRAKGTLLVGEIAQALMLLVVAGLLVNTLVRMNRADPGFDAQHLLSAHLDLPRYAYPEFADRQQLSTRLVEAIGAIPGVVSVGGSTASPFRGRTALVGMTVEGGLPEGASTGLDVIGSDEIEADFWLEWSLVTPGYLESLGLPLVRGRMIRSSDLDRPGRVAIINQAAAEAIWPGQDPIGKRMGAAGGGAWHTIVGVVGDIRHPGFPTPPGPALYAPYGLDALLKPSSLSLAVRTSGDPLDLLEDVKAAIWSIDGDLPIPSAVPMTDRFSGALASARFLAALLALFATLALLLAAIGVYGVVSHQVRQQTHELGIRMALGAPPQAVVRMVFLRSMRLVAIGFFLGCAAAWGATRWLEGLLYGVEPMDLATFGAAAAVLIVVAAIANYLPAHRVTRIDPNLALRSR